ncbi:MAG: MipA/OmpV family protein [Cognaticolwellia aestuarii]
MALNSIQLFVVIALLGISNAALAKNNNEPVSNQQIELGFGAFAVSLPDYVGSDQQTNYLVPFPYFYYRDEHFRIDRQGLQRDIGNKNNWYLDISASTAIPVDSDDNKARQGMPDLDWNFGLGPSVKYYFLGHPDAANYLASEWYFQKGFATDFRSIDDIGWQYGLKIIHQNQYNLSNMGDIRLQTRLNFSFATDKHLNYIYGVKPEYQTKVRKSFQADSGYAGLSLSFGGIWRYKNYWFSGFISSSQISHSKQENSSLVDTKINHSVGVGFSWIFYQQGNRK